MTFRVQSPETVLAQFRLLFDGLKDETDVMCAVGATAYLDHSLGALLHRHFAGKSTSERLLGENGPLGSVSKRGELAYCLGLISASCLANIEIIARIRSEFARGIATETFDSADIAPLCGSLTLPKNNDVRAPTAEETALMDNAIDRIPRARFTHVVLHLCVTIITNMQSIKKCSKLSDYWD